MKRNIEQRRKGGDRDPLRNVPYFTLSSNVRILFPDLLCCVWAVKQMKHVADPCPLTAACANEGAELHPSSLGPRPSLWKPGRCPRPRSRSEGAEGSPLQQSPYSLLKDAVSYHTFVVKMG